MENSEAIPPEKAFVSTRVFGDATVSVISLGVLEAAPVTAWFAVPEADLRRAIPEITNDGNTHMGMNIVHVRIGAASVLFDAGWGDLEPESQYVREYGAVPTLGVGGGLASLGIDCSAITHVLLSHTHLDHFRAVAVERNGRLERRFPIARHLLGRSDWEGNPERSDPQSITATHLGLIETQGQLDLFDGDHEVLPGITMIHTPGESPGHSIVRVQSAGKTLYYLGDLFHHPCEFEHLDWHSPWHDPQVMYASRQRLIADALETDATLVFTHSRFPAWGRVVQTAEGYRWQYMEAHGGEMYPQLG